MPLLHRQPVDMPRVDAQQQTQASTSGASVAHTAHSQTPPPQQLLTAVASTIAWMFLSSAVILLNKNLYALGFERPMFVTGAGQLFSALGGLAIVAMGWQRLRKAPETQFALTRLLPVILAAAASKLCGNSSYLYLSVSFIQILKAFTPALTLLLCAAAGLERLRWPLLLSVLLISAGIAVAVVEESDGEGGAFSWWGVTTFMISSVAEAARVVGAEMLLGGGGGRFNSAEVLIYVGGPTAVLLLTGALIWEDMLPGSSGWGMIAAQPWAFASAFSTSLLLNLASIVAIQSTSSLTFKVAGCVKNVGMVAHQVMRHGERVTPMQVVGYLISVSGFTLYSRLKLLGRKHGGSRHGSAPNNSQHPLVSKAKAS